MATARTTSRPGVDGHPTASLYPFLAGGAAASSAGDADVGALVADVRRSTVAKIEEIVDVRAKVEDGTAERLAACALAMADRFAAGGRLFAYGNGGSSTDAQALAALFRTPTPTTAFPRPPALPAFALTADVAVLTALANDVGFDVVFARQLAAAGRPGDVAVGLSTSGNSENLVQAFGAARRAGMVTVGLAGYDGGRMAACADVDYLFVVDSASVHRIQEAQTTVYHLLWELTASELAAATPRRRHGSRDPRRTDHHDDEPRR